MIVPESLMNEFSAEELDHVQLHELAHIARYDDLVDGEQQPIDLSKVDVSMNGIELQDREFFAAIRAAREPNASLAQCLPAMKTLDHLEQQLRRTD